MGLPSVYVMNVPVLYFENMWALVPVDVCVTKLLPLADVGSNEAIWV